LRGVVSMKYKNIPNNDTPNKLLHRSDLSLSLICVVCFRRSVNSAVGRLRVHNGSRWFGLIEKLKSVILLISGQKFRGE
jgi:hypothetical protein